MAPMSMPSSSDEVATSAAQLPGLQPVLDFDALRPRQRSVVRAHQRFAGELVERRRQPLRDPPAVDEDQRRPVRPDQLQQPRVDRRPDRLAHRALRRPGRSGSPPAGRASPCLRPALRFAAPAASSRTCRRSRPAVFGIEACSCELVVDRLPGPRPCLRAPRCSASGFRCAFATCGAGAIASGAAPPRKRATSSSGRCVADSPMRCSGAAAGERFEPLERQREVRAALGRHQRVDLVDDHRIDRRAAPRGRSKSAAGRAIRAS